MISQRELNSYLAVMNHQRNFKFSGDDCIIAPQNLDQLRSIIKLSHKMDIKIIPTGYTTKINISKLPNHKRIFLSSSKMSKSLDFDKVNGFIELESGVNLRAVEHDIKKLGLNIPIVCDVDLSVGSFISSINPLSKAAFYIKGVKAINSSGEVIVYGTKTQKNVAGYDLTKLYTGTFGKLGYIYSVLIQLIPKDQIYFTFEYFHSINEIKNREKLDYKLFKDMKSKIDPENLFI